MVDACTTPQASFLRGLQRRAADWEDQGGLHTDATTGGQDDEHSNMLRSALRTLDLPSSH